ncbi:hypothetical protein AQUCO_00400125v1 [Aquilegia coerulea]|uniref:Uncharacterized protein n=1 Tax=Aquilegia coerulea TaxID=218851 RepID=A0A2G5ETG1_AQUCA|nr:hypothetical protein AQUCO_00400125v1 [Aquilegia coerulea]
MLYLHLSQFDEHHHHQAPGTSRGFHIFCNANLCTSKRFFLYYSIFVRFDLISPSHQLSLLLLFLLVLNHCSSFKLYPFVSVY